MAKQKTVIVHGWMGNGASVKEAKANAVEKIENAAQGSYTPIVFQYRGMVGFCWREVEGYSYTIVRAGEGFTDTPGKKFGCSFYPTEKEAVRAMLRHVAQNGFVTGEDPTAPAFLTNEEDRREYESWCHWQNGVLAYRNAHPGSSEREWRKAGDDAQHTYHEAKRKAS